jgi:hypothetical protein
MAQSITGEWRKNLFEAETEPVDVYFGKPIDFTDLRPKANMVTTQKRAADRCLDAIKVLADRQRAASAIRDGRDPGAVSIIEKSDDDVRTAAAAAKGAQKLERERAADPAPHDGG